MAFTPVSIAGENKINVGDKMRRHSKCGVERVVTNLAAGCGEWSQCAAKLPAKCAAGGYANGNNAGGNKLFPVAALRVAAMRSRRMPKCELPDPDAGAVCRMPAN